MDELLRQIYNNEPNSIGLHIFRLTSISNLGCLSVAVGKNHFTAHIKEEDLANLSRSLASNQSIQEVHFSCGDNRCGQIFSELVPLLRRNRINRLNLFLSEGIEIILTSLKQFNSLEEFSLTYRGEIQNGQSAVLTQTLSYHHSLEKLEFIDMKCPLDLIIGLENNLLQNKDVQLVRLYLENSELDEERLLYLAKGLRRNSTVKSLDISKNRCTEVGYGALFCALMCSSCVLEELVLDSIDMTDTTAEHLARMLNKNKSITRLYLGHNSEFLTIEGWKHICDALRNPDCMLEFLDLCSTCVNEEVVNFLVHSLALNTSLVELNISYWGEESDDGCEWDGFGVKEIVALLQRPDCTWEVIDVDESAIDDITAVCLFIALTDKRIPLAEVFGYDFSELRQRYKMIESRWGDLPTDARGAFNDFVTFIEDLPNELCNDMNVVMQCIRPLLEAWRPELEVSCDEFGNCYWRMRLWTEHVKDLQRSLKHIDAVRMTLRDDPPRGKSISEIQFLHLMETKITVTFVSETLHETRYIVCRSILVNWICRAYAEDISIPLKSIRFTYEGNTIFLSSAGKKSVGDLFTNDSIIRVSVVSSAAAITVPKIKLAKKEVSSVIKSKKKGGNNNNKKKKKSKRGRKNTTSYSTVDDRVVHSIALSKVHEEAECSQFKMIRQRLNDMNLKRMQPRLKNKTTKVPVSSPRFVENSPTSGVESKAGYSHTLVRVGCKDSLYKTSKPFSNRSNQSGSSRSQTSKVITIDLHGLSKFEALSKLDEALPKWIDVAMNGGYPFVKTVKIIHGCGDQVLAEAVENWIKQNLQVANAPKSMN